MSHHHHYRQEEEEEEEHDEDGIEDLPDSNFRAGTYELAPLLSFIEETANIIGDYDDSGVSMESFSRSRDENKDHIDDNKKEEEEKNDDDEEEKHWMLRIQGNNEIGVDSILLSPNIVSVINTKQKQIKTMESNGISWDYSFQNIHTQSASINSSSSSTSASPRWSLQSHNLLTITYRPRHQALPSYTNISKTRDFLSRLTSCNHNSKHHATTDNRHRLRQRGLFQRKIDWRRDVYTHEDIYKIHVLNYEYRIVGVGSCKAVKIYLRSKQQQKQQHQTKNRNGNEAIATNNMHENMNNDNPNVVFMSNEEEQQHPQMNQGDIVITFAMPKHSNPYTTKTCTPLLWKVSIIQDPSIAIETITVLNGSLSSHCDYYDSNASRAPQTPPTSMAFAKPTEAEAEAEAEPSPTHVFINGWQSWSFTGSVAKGMKQPKSALPDVFSLAFNKGGVLPPLSRPSIQRNNASSVLMSSSKTTKKDYDYYWNSQFSNHFRSDFFTAITTDSSSSVSNSNSGNNSTNSNTIKNDSSGGPAMTLGWLSQRKQFGLITMDANLSDAISLHCSSDSTVVMEDPMPSTTATLNCTATTTTDWAWCQILSPSCYKDEPLANYLDAVARHNEVSSSLQMGNTLSPSPSLPQSSSSLAVGWCSWYHYYERITSQNLIQNFDKLGGLKLEIDCNIVVVDDGYMTAWGDWDSLKPKSFTSNQQTFCSSGRSRNGSSSTHSSTQIMRSISDSIRENGMRPGIWLAPYACDRHSKIAKLHPDWIIRNEKGRYSNSSHCGKFFYGLDATNPAVREHAFRTVRMAVEDWGFEALKLDFLYACCLVGNGKYDSTLTRAETMDLALTNIREAAKPSTFLIGCGCPIGTGINIMNSMRISADTGPTWYPEFPLPWWDNGTLPSLRGMIRNTINRSMFGFRWWHNDPDCLLLGNSTHLTFDELVSAASIVGMTSGMLLLSDDLEKVGNERMDIVKKIYPLTGASALALDLHCTMSSFPSVLRVWCRDDCSEHSVVNNSTACAGNGTFIEEINEKKTSRDIVHVAHNLGASSIVSLSNWYVKTKVIQTPLINLLPGKDQGATPQAGKFGYHLFSFWSSQYIWIPDPKCNPEATLSTRLEPHETEIFHLNPVEADRPQYVGSTLHFSCGFEVKSFEFTENTLQLQLKNEWRRTGWIYLFIPRTDSVVIVSVMKADGKMEVPAAFEMVTTLPQPNNDEEVSESSPKEICLKSMGRIIRLKITIQGQTRTQSQLQQNHEEGTIIVHF